MKSNFKTLLIILPIIFIVGFLLYNDNKTRSDDHVETWEEFCQVINSPSREGFFFTKSRTFELEEIRKQYASYLNVAIKNNLKEEFGTNEDASDDIINEFERLKILGAWTENTEIHIAYYSFLDGTYNYYIEMWEKLLDDKNYDNLSNFEKCSTLTLDGFFTKLILHTNENDDIKTFDLKYYFKNDVLKK